MKKRVQEFLHHILALKTLKRQGWIEHGVSLAKVESVADHTFGTCLLALFFAKELDCDILNILQLALIHDLAESIVGDITPKDGISHQEKISREYEAMVRLNGLVPMDILTLWEDYELEKTLEARVIKNIDKLEMILQALVYEGENEGRNFDDFWNFEFSNEYFKKFKSLRGI